MQTTIYGMSAHNLTLQSLIERLWIAPENAEWTPKTTVVPLSELQSWMTSDDIEVLGYVDSVIHEHRFRIEPPLSTDDYVRWVKHYCGRCYRENPDGEWSDSSYSAGWELVRIFIALWDEETVPRSALQELKNWIAEVYKSADERLRTCIVQATLEHLFERKPIRQYFSDWKRDAELAKAYREACLWDMITPLSE
jgi:hypothetical protein